MEVVALIVLPMLLTHAIALFVGFAIGHQVAARRLQSCHASLAPAPAATKPPATVTAYVYLKGKGDYHVKKCQVHQFHATLY